MKRLGRPAYPLAVEKRYTRVLLARVRQVHAFAMKSLKGVLVDDGTRSDALSGSSTIAAIRIINSMAESVDVKIPVPTREVAAAGKAIDYAATAKAAKNVQKIAGHDMVSAASVRGEFTPIQWDTWVQDNVRLIKTIDARYFNEIADLVNQAADGAWSAKDLTTKIQDRFGVAKSRARVIARDQVGRLHSQIDRERHTEAGITHFVWRTSMDERVRDEHQKLEGEIFSYAEGAPGEGLPGQPIQCRCVAEPVIDPDLLEESDERVEDAPEEEPQETTIPTPAGFAVPDGPTPYVAVPEDPEDILSAILESEAALGNLEQAVKDARSRLLDFDRDSSAYFASEMELAAAQYQYHSQLSDRLLLERAHKGLVEAPLDPDDGKNDLQRMLERAQAVARGETPSGGRGYRERFFDQDDKIVDAKVQAEKWRLVYEARKAQRDNASQIEDWSSRVYKENEKEVSYTQSTGFTDDFAGGGKKKRMAIGQINTRRRNKRIQQFRRNIDEEQDLGATLGLVPRDQWTKEFAERHALNPGALADNARDWNQEIRDQLPELPRVPSTPDPAPVRPQHSFKNAAEASQYVKDRGVAKHVSFRRGWDAEGLSRSVETIEEMNDRWGMDPLMFIGDQRYYNAEVADVEGKSRVSGAGGRQVIAGYWEDGVFVKKATFDQEEVAHRMKESNDYISGLLAPSQVQASLQRAGHTAAAKRVRTLMYQTDWKPIHVISTSTERALQHELGHRFHLDHADEDFDRLVRKYYRDGWPNVIGRYAASKPSEYAAESMVAYMNGEWELLPDELIDAYAERDKNPSVSKALWNERRAGLELSERVSIDDDNG